MTSTYLKRAAAVALAASLAACSGGGGRPAVAPPPAHNDGASLDGAFDLLMRGDAGGARKQLKALLRRDPRDAEAQMLLASMDGDAREQLGPQNYLYTVKSGETIVTLAQRLLGNRYKAYQLARYNDLKAPVTLSAGQTLRIPGNPPRPPEPVRRPDPTPALAPTRPAPTTPNPAPVRPKPSAPAANPAAARQARAAGLAALNQGKVNQAVVLLRRAAALDPGNALIARDLGRAQRIAATVRAKR